MDRQPIHFDKPAIAEIPMWNHEKIQRSFERYEIFSFSEQSDPESAEEAQRGQGGNYEAAGYVHKTALDETGRLHPDLDRSRGDNVEYVMGYAKDNGRERRDFASVRIVHIPEGGTLDDLAAYRYCKDTLDPVYEYELRSIIATQGTESVKEIAALSKSETATSIASFEVIRDIVQQAIRRDMKEKWLATFVPNAYFAMYENFGEDSVQQIGDPVAVDVGDPRTSDSLRLIPTLITPCEVPDQIVSSMEKTPLDQPQFEKLARSLFFITDGLNESELSPKVQNCMTLLKSMMSKGA